MSASFTPRQSDLLHFIHGYVARYGFAPSYDEMQRGIGAGTRGGIHRMVCALEERGHIRRLPYRARSIEVLFRPVASRAPDGTPLYFVPSPVAFD